MGEIGKLEREESERTETREGRDVSIQTVKQQMCHRLLRLSMCPVSLCRGEVSLYASQDMTCDQRR
jgi:hypothetical protein